MSRQAVQLALAAALFAAACSQTFRFTDGDAGAPLDGGSSDGGSCALPGECECDSSAQCSGARPLCAPDRRCVECLEAADCGSGGQCDLSTSRCTRSCVSDGDCMDGGIQDKCEGDAQRRHCTACDDDGPVPDCVAPQSICAESVGLCVGCKRNSDCGGATARCDKRSGTCVECLASSDCGPASYCQVAAGTCALRP